MYSRILNCDYEFVSPWWDEVSLNAKDLVSPRTFASVDGLVLWMFSLNWSCPGLVFRQVSKLIVLDPRQRLNVREALDHPWVLGKAARFSHMDTTQRKLQEFNARRKLKVRTAVGFRFRAFILFIQRGGGKTALNRKKHGAGPGSYGGLSADGQMRKRRKVFIFIL